MFFTLETYEAKKNSSLFGRLWLRLVLYVFSYLKRIFDLGFRHLKIYLKVFFLRCGFEFGSLNFLKPFGFGSTTLIWKTFGLDFLRKSSLLPCTYTFEICVTTSWKRDGTGAWMLIMYILMVSWVSSCLSFFLSRLDCCYIHFHCSYLYTSNNSSCANSNNSRGVVNLARDHKN
jgi:hypothetical protein